MSHYETPEQRQIKELRGKIRVQDSKNSKLKKELKKLHEKQKKENAHFLEQIKLQQEASRRERSEMNDTIRALDETMKKREELQCQRIEKIQIQHEKQIENLEQEFEDEREELRNKILQTRSEMKEGLANLRAETEEKLKKERSENDRKLSQTVGELEDQIQSVDKKVSLLAQQIITKEDEQKKLAEYWAQEAARVLKQIRGSFRHQLLDTRKISNIERDISQANKWIEIGLYQSSITAGREAFLNASDIKKDLVADEFEWNYWFYAVKSRELELLEELNSAKNRIYEVEMEDGTYEYTQGIDYWTFGQLSIVEEQISKFRESIENIESMTLLELQKKEQDLYELQGQLALTENTAHINVAMSVSRYETAVKIGNILDSNYEMSYSDGSFFGKKNREEFHAIFQNPSTGDQIATVITPVPDEVGVVTNHIELIVGNIDNNPITIEIIAREVAEKLRISGVEGCSFPCARRYGDETMDEVVRVGNIEAVEMGDEKVRATLPRGSIQGNDNVSRIKRR